MDQRLGRRSPSKACRRLLGAGFAFAALALPLALASSAGAQTAPGSTIEFGPITIVTDPSGSIVVEADFGDVELAIVSTTSDPAAASFFAAVELEAPGIDVVSTVSAASSPGSSTLVAVTSVDGDDADFFVTYSQSCRDGVVVTSSTIGTGGSVASVPGQAGAAGDPCPPLFEPPPDPPLPVPEPPPAPGGTDVPLELPPPTPDTPPAPDPPPFLTPPAPAPVDDGAGTLAPPPAPASDPDPPPPSAAGPAAPAGGPPAAAPVPVPAALVLVSFPLTPAPAAAVVGGVVAPPTATVVADVVVPDVVVPPPAPPAPPPPPAPAPTPGLAAPAPSPPGPARAAGQTVLTAITRDGVASGPPGVGLTVSGTGFPARSGVAGPRQLAASAQLTGECQTIYFFFDDQRIGSATPDASGAVRRTGLSVPGGASPGRHPVTASCRSAGTPVLAATEFVVTDASLHRTAFVTALPRTEHVRFDLAGLLLSALGALALLALIAFPAELFNTTLEEHYDEVRGWFGLRPRRATAGAGVSHVVLFVTFLALSGPLWFAMQSSSDLNLATALGALGLSLATAFVVLASDLPTFAHLRRRYGERAHVVALPGTLLVALACVLISRAVRFEPGYFYGLVGGLAFSRRLPRDASGRLAASSVLLMLALSVVTWLILTPVSHIADRPDPGAWPLLAESFLGGVFWAALDSLVIALLPLRLLTGSKVVGWSRGAWAVLYVFTFAAFIHILLRPGTGYVSDTTRSPTVVVVCLFVGFALFSFGFWGYFRFRSPHPGDKATATV